VELLGIGFLKQCCPELIRLLFVRTEHQLSTRIERQSVVDDDIDPLAVLPKPKMKYAFKAKSNI
jgi:hypothetical protein